MARIRTIKPEFWRDESLSSVSPEAALLAIGLLNHCDDEGYFNANPKLIESDIFPLRELSGSVTQLLKELHDIGYVEVFLGSDSKRYGLVVNFEKHQVINKKTSSKIKQFCNLPYDYSSDHVALPTGKERKGTGNKEQGAGKSSSKKQIDLNGFEQFLEAYGKKIDRAGAEKAWSKIKWQDGLLDLIIKQAKAYSNSVSEKQFQKHAATWLNGECWNDEIISSKPKQTGMIWNNIADQDWTKGVNEDGSF